jgi:superfamily I DNA/RNA helicase/RecB family exonuclease
VAPERVPLVPDPEQARVLDLARGTLLVTGPPGSGKTTLLRERFARLVETGVPPERLVLLTLNRRAAREAREWLLNRLRRSVPDLPVYTAHGWAFRILGRRFGDLGYDHPPQVLSAPEQYAVVRKMLREDSPDRWTRFAELLTIRGFAREVADFCLRAQERLLEVDDLDALVARSGRDEYGEIAGFYRRYLGALTAAGQCDFAGLLRLAVALLGRGIGEEDRFDHVLVDDYQDATLATEGIVRALGAAAHSVVVAADPNGHVFSYRGGTLEPLARAREVLGATDQVTLPRSQRLGSGAAALAALEDPAAPPAAEPPPAVDARVFAHPGEEVEAVAHELLRSRVEDDVAWEEMAVILRRYGEYLTALRHALTRHGVPFVIVAEASAVATEPANRQVIDLFRFAFREEGRGELVDRVLTSSLVGLDPHGLRRLRREARVRDMPLLELVSTGDLARLPDDLHAAVDGLRALVAQMPRVAEERGPDGLFFWLWSQSEALPHFRSLVSSAERGRDRDLDALAALGDVLSNFVERRPGATIQDYLDTLEAAEFGSDPWILPEERHPHAVRIVSAHRAHGIEVEVALVVGCLEGEFPSLSHGYSMVDLDAIVAPRTARERLAERLSDERALFRLAVSRARRRTMLLASRSTSARNPRTPSRFASRLRLEWTQPEEILPAASLRSMEAGLRRRLADRGAGPGERIAALAVLGRVGADPAEWWGGRGWTIGAALYSEDEELRTSYSRLSSLENCALQYLYATEMGLDPDETYQMWMGSLVHRIIDRCQQGEMPRTVEALHGALEESWKPSVFPNRAIEHRRFLDAKEMLRRWIDHESPDIERSEVRFKFPIDGAMLRGRIDAVFRMQNGHLRVVDYKTSRYAPTKEEAQNDLQLAAYFLALKRDPDLAGLGEPGYLELAYLGKPHYRSGFVKREVAPRKVDGYEEWADGRLRELLKRVRSEDFAPSPEADCTFCRFRTICPVWPEGGEVQL